MPDLSASIIIPLYNGAPFIKRCLQSLRAQQGVSCQVIVVDNASTDGSAELVAMHFPEVTLLRNASNEGFSRGVNRGIVWALSRPRTEDGGPRTEDREQGAKSGSSSPASGLQSSVSRTPLPDIVVLLNQDTVAAPDWLPALLNPFEVDERVGAVGCKIYDHDGLTLQHAGGELAYPRATSCHIGQGETDRGQYDQPGEMAYVTGAAMGLRVTALHTVGLLDERFSPAYMEEVDLCWRLRAAGWKVWYNPAAQVRHVEHGSPLTIIPRLTLLHRNRLRFVFKHYRFEQLLSDFWPAERRALATVVGTFDQPALLRAYLDALLLLDEFAAARADTSLPPFSPSERHAAVTMLRELRNDLRRLCALGWQVRQQGVTG